jgi:hypothetical protein
MSEIPQEAYAKEYYYQARVKQQGDDFRDLLNRYPEDDEEVRRVLKSANALAASRDPSRVLSPDKLDEIKDKKPEVFARISPVYTEFLMEKAGLT